MSGGNLVYMRTLTDTPAGGVSIFCAHVTDYGRGHDVGLTTRDADLSFLPLPEIAGSPVTYRASKLSGDITTTQSADISGGKGFMAPSIDGELTVVDGDGKIAQDIGGGHFVPVGWSVWVAEWDETYSLAHHLVQMQVVEYTVAAGVVRFALRSPNYLADPPLHGTKVSTQIETDPVDSMNPTDPTYADSAAAISQRTSFAGLMLGSRDLSIKGQIAADPVKLTRWKESALLIGDVSGSGTSSEAFVSDTHGTNVGVIGHNSAGAVNVGVGCFFGVKSDAFGAEAARLDNQIQAFVMAGYRIILSDGRWFCDFLAQPLWTGDLNTGVNTISSVAGIPFGSQYSAGHYCGQWFNTTDANGSSLLPPNFDVTRAEIFAIPSTANITYGQTSLIGIARDNKVTRISAGTQFVDGIEQLLANLVSASGMVGCENIPFSISMDGFANVPATGATGQVKTGSTADIHTDASNPWSSGSSVQIGAHNITAGSSSLQSYYAILKLRIGTQSVDADFFCGDMTFEIPFTAVNLTGSAQDATIYVWPAFEDAPFVSGNFLTRLTKVIHMGAGATVSGKFSQKADPNRSSPIWSIMFDSIDAMNGFDCPAMYIKQNLTTLDAVMSIRDIFLWAFRIYSFNQLYPVAFPFWTRSTLVALATDGAGKVVAGGTGLATVAADGSQAWAAITLPTVGDLTVHAGRSAYGAGKYVTVGYIGVSTSPYSWNSATGANGTWSPVSLGGTSLPLRIRYVGTKFVVLFADGTIRTSTDGTTWSAAITTGASVAWDIAFDGTNYLVFGPAGHVYKSTNLTTWADVPSAGIDAAVGCAIWDAVHANFVAMGATGKAYIAGTSSALAGTWTQFATGTSGGCEDIGIGLGGLVAVGKSVGILVSADGSAWLNPEPKAFDGGLYVSGFNCSVVWTGSAWVVGGYGLAWTYAIDKGHATWIPWLGASPENALQNLRGRFLGGLQFDSQNGSTNIWNPLRWTGGKATAQSWGIAFDPPENADSGTTATAGARKICEEWWFQAGEMPATVLDGSSDQIEMALPEINLGNIEDVATLITVQFQPFGGEYLGKAYVQNVDVDRATAGKPDSFFFAGWDATGNTHGLAIWTACRAAYLSTGALRSVSLTYDSIHDPATLGSLWTTVDADLGTRIDWLCERPQYLKILAYGNDSKAATAYCGARYKPNFRMLNARGMSALNATGYGVVVNVSHNFTTGEHALELAFPPA